MAFPFRILRTTRAAAPAGTQNVPGPPPPPPPGGLASYMDRLTKLIPGEVLALYLTVRGFFAGDSAPAVQAARTTFLEWWPLACIALLVAFRLWGTRDDSGSIQSAQPVAILVSVISFVIWIYAMGHTLLGWAPPDPSFAGAAVAVWVFVVPMFYRG